MDEPRATVVIADHFSFAVKPDNAPVASKDSIKRFQWLTRQEQFRSFDAPSILVVWMDLLIPAHRIIQPFFLSESQYLFDLRANICLANTFIHESHKNDCRDLFN